VDDAISFIKFLLPLVEQINSKYQKHSKHKKAPKQAVKEASRKAKRAKVRSISCMRLLESRILFLIDSSIPTIIEQPSIFKEKLMKK